jgi:hypothetical protein
MANKYFSVLRDYVARNIAEETLSPPADLVVDGAGVDFKEQLATHHFINNPEEHGNIILKEVAVFSNFADGLVFKSANESIDLNIRAIATKTWSDIGNVSTTLGSKTMTGAGFIANLNPDDIIRIANAGSWYFAIIDSVTDDNNAELRDYAQITLTAQSGDTLTDSSGDNYIFRNIRALNTFYKAEYFFTPSTIVTGDLTDLLVVVQPNFNLGTIHDDVTFLTKSISTDFEEDAVYFDAILRMEVTTNQLG